MRRLPPGQRSAPLLRFGLPQFAVVRPDVPGRPVVTVGGVVRHPGQVELADLLATGPTREQRSDLHCVTTWTATGLRWGGVPFRAVYEVLAATVEPHPRCRWIVFAGLDGYRACLRIDDALADDVLLATTLDGEPLTVEQGGPARLVVPAQYGYKGVRHLCGVEFRRTYDPGSAGWLAHRRGRVALEERSPLLPGWVWRVVWRRSIGGIRRRYAIGGPAPTTRARAGPAA